jgi:NAD(P)-dependent dehydrogenase (short-subunit alcohol dehydrogenase family)
MVARGSGLIVNILDQSAFHPDPAYFAHTIGKTGLLGMTPPPLAMELAPAVRVNAIVPGPVLPPPDFTPEQESRIAQSTLLRRWGTPEDVAHALPLSSRSGLRHRRDALCGRRGGLEVKTPPTRFPDLGTAQAACYLFLIGLSARVPTPWGGTCSRK